MSKPAPKPAKPNAQAAKDKKSAADAVHKPAKDKLVRDSFTIPASEYEVIAQINRELGTTAVVITHNAAIAGMADRVIYLGDGHILRVERNAHKVSPSELSW